MIIEICIGSSCHLKGSPEIIEMLNTEIKEHNLENEITLAGSFCMGVCNRTGVSIRIDDEIHTGINRENFREFFSDKVLSPLQKERM